MKKVIIWGIGFYRKYISNLKSAPTCRFSPSCSEYALQAIEAHGVLKGLVLSINRVARCNPYSKGGLDPVPVQYPSKVKNLNHEQ